jgi:malonate transporter and related proteins
MQVADLILPVFAVIVTGWLAGYLGYVARDLSDALIHFAYNVAMPALLIVTIAQEPARSLLAWRFLVAFGGGSLLCFAIVFASLRAFGGQGLAGAAMQGWAASMTNYRLRRASSPPGDLRGSRGVARGDCDGVCRGCHVSRSGAHAGA